MRILWVPHTTFQPGVKTRAEYFIEHLPREHAVHVLCWDVPIRRTARGIRSTLRSWTRTGDHGVTYHHLPRLPLPFPGRRPLLTQATFRRAVRRIVARHEIDLVIAACNWYALGFPPPDLPVPLVIDYFDLLEDGDEEWYFTHADAVVSSSSVLHERARKYPAPSHYVPNGVDTSLFLHANGDGVRAEYGLGGTRIVSLIGITTSARLYFLDAVELAARRMPEIKCLIVGDGELLPAIKARIRGREHLFRLTGAAPYERMPEFFACTDVGLYPGDLLPHFHAALPIKVLEYSAAGKPVVAPPLEELIRLRFGNLVFASPTPESFADGICLALQSPASAPDLSRFEIRRVAAELSEALEQIIDQPRHRAAH